MTSNKIPGVQLFDLTLHRDQRGFFTEVFRGNFVQFNRSWSTFGTLRGLHYQPNMAKFVYCSSGEIFDVVLDTKTGKHDSFVLNHNSVLYVPAGLAHGFLALQDSDVVYACSAEYDPKQDFGVHWTSAGITWPFEPKTISLRDQKLPRWVSNG